MHTQLQSVIDELGAALARLRALASAVPADAWPRRPHPARWSVAECVAHLNLTSEAYLPLLRRALEQGRGMNEAAPARYRRDPAGWLLWRTMGPPVRVRTRTIAAFVPTGERPAEELLADFARLQAELVAVLREAEGLPLHRLRITSPFTERVRYNVYSALTILPRHQHRHLWQAERAWERVAGHEDRDGRPST